MTKVKKEVVHGAIIKLIDKITATMPDTKYKFLIGGVTAFATIKSTDKIDSILQYVSTEDGFVDVDLLENMVDCAFKASDGKVQIELFNQGGLINMFVKPLTLTIQKEDISEIIKEMRNNAANTDVILSEQKKTE